MADTTLPDTTLPDATLPEVAGPDPTGHTVLVVPVPLLEPLVRGRHEHYDTDYVSSDPSFAHAHLTVLAPFVAPAELTAATRHTVAQIAWETRPFEVSLTRVATFPNGIVHLVPEPAEPLRALTERFCRAFPTLLPYGGAFGSVEPHVTIDALGPDVTEDTVRAWVAPLLPSPLRVERLQLSWYAARDCRTLAAWELGPSRVSRG